MKNLFITFSLILGFATIEAQNIQLKVDAAKQIATATPLLNGTNIEDINNQTNGGVFSQLLHGEAFEENIDTDILNLERSDYSKIYIMVDERGIPHLLNQSYVYCSVGWNSLDEECDVHSYDVYNYAYAIGKHGATSKLRKVCKRRYMRRYGAVVTALSEGAAMAEASARLDCTPHYDDMAVAVAVCAPREIAIGEYNSVDSTAGLPSFLLGGFNSSTQSNTPTTEYDLLYVSAMMVFTSS